MVKLKKLRVNKEVKEALDKLISLGHSKESLMLQHGNVKVNNRTHSEEFEILNTLTMIEFSLAINVGYKLKNDPFDDFADEHVKYIPYYYKNN